MIFATNQTFSQHCMWLRSNMKEIFRRTRKIVSYTLLSVVTFCFARIFYLLVSARFFHNVDEVSRSWQVNPIVSIHVTPQYQRCPLGYEKIYIDHALNGIGSLLPDVKSKFWRMSTICIKRGGKAAVSYTERRLVQYRQVPDINGKCHDGFQKCGDGFNQHEAAICFPSDAECPITNILVLPADTMPPANAFWETAGHFAHSSHTLYFRRQYIGELPIVDVTFQLTEFDSNGKGVRGVCYEGPSQTITSTVANIVNSSSYNVTLPPACTVSDGRYTVVDQVPLAEHFSQNLESVGPARTVKEQSGVYGSIGATHVNDAEKAVRAAFQDADHVTLGMYIAREASWRESCGNQKEYLFRSNALAEGCCIILVFICLFWLGYNAYWTTSRQENMRYLYDFAGFLFVAVCFVIDLCMMIQMGWYYEMLENADCTDATTSQEFRAFLYPAYLIMNTGYLALFLLTLLILDSLAWYNWTKRHYTIKTRRIHLPDHSIYNEVYLQPIVPVAVPVASTVAATTFVPNPAPTPAPTPAHHHLVPPNLQSAPVVPNMQITEMSTVVASVVSSTRMRRRFGY